MGGCKAWIWLHFFHHCAVSQPSKEFAKRKGSCAPFMWNISLWWRYTKMNIHTTTRHNSHDKPVVLEAGWQICMSSNSPSAGKIEGSTSKKNHRTAHLISQCRVRNMAPWQFPHKPRSGWGERWLPSSTPLSRKIQNSVGWSLNHRFSKGWSIDSMKKHPTPMATWIATTNPVVDLKDPHPQGPNDGTLANQRSMALGALPRLRTWQLFRVHSWLENPPFWGWYWWFRNPANQLRLAVYPIIYRFCFTSQVVVWDFFHQQYLPGTKKVEFPIARI